MPFYLKESIDPPRLAGFRSVLIVPCRFCPAASLAVRKKQPYLQLLRRLLRTEAYESFIKDLKRRLQDQGIKTAVFDSKLLHQFVACMCWLSRGPGHGDRWPDERASEGEFSVQPIARVTGRRLRRKETGSRIAG